MATYNERGRFKYIDSSGNTYNLYHPLERAPALQGGDLNDAPANSLYVLTTDYTYTNLPDDSYAGNASWLFTYGTTASGGARLQILYVPYNSEKMYMRRRGSAWNSWIDITAMTEVTTAPTTSTGSGTALSGRTFARYGMQYGTVVDGSRQLTVQDAGYTSLNDLKGNTIFVCNRGYDIENMPEENNGWVITIGAYGSAAKFQFYFTYNGAAVYVRHYSPSSGWRSWTKTVTEVTASPTLNTGSSTALSALSFARYGMQYGAFVDDSWIGTVQGAGYTSLDDLRGNTIFVCNTGYDIDHMPEDDNGWVITIGAYGNAAKLQFYVTLNNVIYSRSYDAYGGWSWKEWVKHTSSSAVSPAKMYSIGNSILTGSVWVNDKYDHLVSYEYSPYGCIANAAGISEDNVSHTLISSTGILYDAGEGNFRDMILAADLSDYDLLVTHAWFRDLDSSFAFGSIDSTDSSTLCGAIRAIVDYCRQQNPAMHVVIISPQVVSTTDQASDAPFDYQFGDGYTRREIDEMLHEMADKYRFIYVDWQSYDPAYHWKDFVDTSNVHACEDRYYLGMGGYLGGRISAEVRF